MLSIARERVRSALLVQARFDARLPFLAESFDLVYSTNALHYSTQLDALYTEVVRVSTVGKCFLFMVPHPIRHFVQKTKARERER